MDRDVTPIGLTVDQWRKAVNTAATPMTGSGSRSAEEWRAAWGCGIHATRRLIREGVRLGTMTVGRRTIQAIDGTRKPVPVYGLAPAAGSRKKRG
jgi:hypothetical protein